MLNALDAATETASCPAFFSGFDQIDFGDVTRVLLAVSGGSDSTALLAGFCAYCRARALDVDIVVATVDHGLRAGSADEAAQVATLCEQLGVTHQTLRWEGEKPKSSVQAKARKARYELLSQCADEVGADLVLTGHTLDDRVETMRMQTERSGREVSASIARATLYRKWLWFVRPLLDATRAELRDYLTAAGVDWIDDPSNDNRRFERVRVRQDNTLSDAELRDQGRAIEQLNNEQQRASQAAAASLTEESVVSFDADTRRCILSVPIKIDEPLLLAISACLMWVGGKEHLPSKAIEDQITELVIERRNGSALTVHGCLLTFRDEQLTIEREARASPSPNYGFGYLVTAVYYPLASAIEARVGGCSLPKPKISNATR